MAHIEKRTTRSGKARYRVQITLKGHPRVTETFPTRRAAERWAEATTAAIRQRRYQPASEADQHTLGDLVERYIEVKAGEFAKPQERIARLCWWRDELGATIRLSQITPQAIARSMDRLGSGKAKGRKLSPATVLSYLAALSSALGTAHREWFWLTDNPCRRIVRPKAPRGRARFLDEDEKRRLLDACRRSAEPRLYPLVVTAMATGARRGELMSLRWNDVDLERGTALLHHTKNGERRMLTISGLALSVIRDWRNASDASCPFVFPGPRKPSCGYFCYQPWYEALAQAGIEDFHFHDLRHTFASYLAMSGATLAELAEALGHKTLSMVKRYAHMTQGHTASVITRMTGLFLDDRATEKHKEAA